MAKFIYRMQSILDIKYKLENQAKSIFADASFKLQEEEKKLKILQDRKLDYEEKLTNLFMNKLDLLKIKETENAIETIKFSIKMQHFEVKKAEQNLENARKKLSEIMIERKTQEILREKAFEEFKLDVNYEERKEIDELVSFKYNIPVGSEDEV
jgi:flagellar FliJ protein